MLYMDLIEAMEERHAVREYTDRQIDDETKAKLQEVIDECNKEGNLNIQLFTDEPGAFDESILIYGKIKNGRNYFAMIGENAPDLEERVGYYGEKLVLSAQQMGLNTCWVGTTYKKMNKLMNLRENDRIVLVIALGYGENQGDNVTAIYGKNETDLNSVAVQYTNKFIPKTTFTYGAAGSGGGGGEVIPEGTLLDNVLALKNFQFADPMADSEDVVLTLDNAKVTYVNTENDFVVIEDESAGYALENSKLSSLVSAGQTLNGNLAMTILYGWAGNEYSLKNGIEGVTATDGEVTPFVVTEENAITFANDFDWRLAQVANVKINITTGEHGDQMSASIAQLGDMKLPINDRFNTITTTVEDGMVGTLTGFIFSAYGMTFCTPVSFVENVKAVELENLKALEEFTLEEGVDEVKAVLTLKDAKVTYVADNYDAVVIEDESTGYNFEYAGFNELLTAGQVLNGTLDITIAPFWFGTINVTVNNGLDNVESTTAEVTPIVVTEENISTYMNDYQWRYAEIANVVINVKQDGYGKYFTLSNELLGEEEIWINNTFKQFDETVEDGTTGTLRGFLFNSYSQLWFTPLSFDADVTSINNVENNMKNNGVIYNMNGQRLSAPVRGINIINGKKVVIK